MMRGGALVRMALHRDPVPAGLLADGAAPSGV